MGRTENALRALLMRTLTGTPVHSYEEWVTLNLIDSRAGGVDDDAEALRGVLAVDRASARFLLDDLVARGLLLKHDERNHVLSRDGSDLLADLRSAVAGTSRRMLDGLALDDLAVTVRTLDRIRARADHELANTPGGHG